jgi:hypothetical protein
MEQTQLSRIFDDLAKQYSNVEALGYFECLQALDALDFHILDRMDPADESGEMARIKDRAEQLHARLASAAQAVIDGIVRDIQCRQLTPLALRQLVYHYAGSVPDKSPADQPDYDLFDDFLSSLFQVDYEPAETHSRSDEMIYLQPTPGRVILEMINELHFTQADRFYDLGSGLGRVPVLVSLLTGVSSVGIEVEPTYVDYSRSSALKLGTSNVEFRNLDARDADLSDGTIFFMYSPFTGSILRRVLEHLHDLSKRQPITLCTYGPCTPIIEREAWLHSVRSSHGRPYRLAILRSA